MVQLSETSKLAAIGLLMLGGVRLAYAEPAPGPVYNPANGHWYEAVSVTEALFWDDARAAAEARSYLGARGHLATLTSPKEQEFVAGRLADAIEGEFYLGGIQRPDGAEPAGGWQWITGEPWSYANWAPGEPNDANEGESRLSFTKRSRAGGWNDVPAQRFPVKGYVVEYEPRKPASPPVKPGAPPIKPKTVNPARRTAVAAPMPDLMGVWRSLDQRTRGTGTELRTVVFGELANRNDGRKLSQKTRVRFFLSPENRPDHPRKLLLQEAWIPPLKPGKSVLIRLSAPLATGTHAIGQYVVAEVNPTSNFPETHRQNNVVSRKVL